MQARQPRLAVAGWIAAVSFAMFATVISGPDVEARSGTMQRILYGEVISAERITIKDAPTGRGSRTGSTVGAVAGYALADRRDRWLGALIGGVIGGAAGNAAEKAKGKKAGWELIIRLDNGEEVGIEVPMGRKGRKVYASGDRVRLMSGRDGQTKVTKVS